MGAGFHGGFGGTYGSQDLPDKQEKTTSKSADNEQPKTTSYKSTQKLRNHIESAEKTNSGSEGIKGAHHKDNFINEANRIGAKITETVPNSQIDGVEKISYKMPMKDGKGNLTGSYKAKTFHKTVYNQAKIVHKAGTPSGK